MNGKIFNKDESFTIDYHNIYFLGNIPHADKCMFVGNKQNDIQCLINMKIIYFCLPDFVCKLIITIIILATSPLSPMGGMPSILQESPVLQQQVMIL